MSNVRTISVADIIVAAKKGGHPWQKGLYGIKSSRCILEQVAINVGLEPENWGHLSYGLNNLAPDVGGSIYAFNDSIAENYQEAAKNLVDTLRPFRMQTITFDLEQEV